MSLKPDCGTLPWLAAALTIIGSAGRLIIPGAIVWANYLFFGVVAAFALIMAYFGWKCHIERQLPAPHLRRLIQHLAREEIFLGTVAQFNVEAQKVLYEQEFSQIIRESTDYYSLLIASDYIKIIGVSNVGQPDSCQVIVLTDRGQKLIKILRKHDGV